MQAKYLDNEQPGVRQGGPKIISIGGGKGGIGKSFLSANIALRLASQGFETAIVDLDFGAANLHTCLGVQSPKQGLFDFVSGQVENLEDIGISGGAPRLTLYGGGQEFWQQVKPQSAQKIRLITKLQQLPVDYILLDLGAGTHVNTLDFFIFSHAGILVVVPEPTSIENAYVFLKSVLYRKLQSIVKALQVEEIAAPLLASLNNPKVNVPPFIQLTQFSNQYPEVGQRIMHLMQLTQLGILMNQVRSQADKDLGVSMTQICKVYFGFSSSHLGFVRYDDAVWKSVRSRKPLAIDNGASAVNYDLEAVTKHLFSTFAPPVQALAK